MTASLLGQKALAPSTLATYHRALSLYTDFMMSVFHSNEFFPISNRHALAFITYLYAKGLNGSTITTYLSAISFYCKMLGIHDPTNTFPARKLLTALKRTNGSPDSRLPISPEILGKLLSLIPATGLNIFGQLLFSAMYLLAFSAFLRVGEFTTKSNGNPKLILQIEDITFTKQDSIHYHMQIAIKHFKGNVTATPVFIIIPMSNNPSMCPVRAILQYLHMRGNKPGPLFVWESGLPVHREQFARMLKLNLRLAGLAADDFKGHSFRIGACSFASSCGIPMTK